MLFGQPRKQQYIPLGLPCGSPEVPVGDLMDVHAKELFGSVFEDVLEKAFGASALVPHQRHVSSFSQPAAQETTVRNTSAATQCLFDRNPFKQFFLPLS